MIARFSTWRAVRKLPKSLSRSVPKGRCVSLTFGTQNFSSIPRHFFLLYDRQLEHSTILFETPDARPLLRCAWNQGDGNYVACFALDSDRVTVVDVRAASLPVAQLSLPTHQQGASGVAPPQHRVQAIRWNPAAANQLIVSDLGGTVALWDLAEGTETPAWINRAFRPVQQIALAKREPRLLALGARDLVQVVAL